LPATSGRLAHEDILGAPCPRGKQDCGADGTESLYQDTRASAYLAAAHRMQRDR
jgi:hypothetical protein